MGNSEVATSLLPSQGPRRGGTCYVTLAFSGVLNAKRRGKYRSGYLTPAFSGAHKRAEMLRNPCILEVPNREQFRSGFLTPTFSRA